MTRSEVLDAARSRWPGIRVDDSLLPETDHDLPPYAVELVLARACLTGDPAATTYVHRDMFVRVDHVLARLGLSATDADDIKQDVRAKLLVGADARLAQYRGTGPLAQWIAAVAGREALGMMRRRKPTGELGDEDLFDASDDPQLAALKNQHSAEFKEAFQSAVEALPPRDRAVLRALIVDDRSVPEIAAVYGIHRATAARWVADIRQALLQGTRKRLGERLHLEDSSLDSAIRLIDSNLDLSLFRLLNKGS